MQCSFCVIWLLRSLMVFTALNLLCQTKSPRICTEVYPQWWRRFSPNKRRCMDSRQFIRPLANFSHYCTCSSFRAPRGNPYLELPPYPVNLEWPACYVLDFVSFCLLRVLSKSRKKIPCTLSPTLHVMESNEIIQFYYRFPGDSEDDKIQALVVKYDLRGYLFLEPTSSTK